MVGQTSINWYRYHALFADMLRQRLKRVNAEPIFTLHSLASEWYERNGQFSQAIEQAMVARKFDWTTSLVEQVAQATLNREVGKGKETVRGYPG